MEINLASEKYYDLLSRALVEFCKSTNYLFYFALEQAKVTMDPQDNMVVYYRATDIDGDTLKLRVTQGKTGLELNGFKEFVNGVDAKGLPGKGDQAKLHAQYFSALDLLTNDIVRASEGLGVDIADIIFETSEVTSIFQKSVTQRNGEERMYFGREYLAEAA